MSTLLVMTVGQTDVQIVRPEVRKGLWALLFRERTKRPQTGVRCELRKERCAHLHDELARRSWRLVEAPQRKARPVETLPKGEVLLCTPKLDAVLQVVKPTAVLLLETRRDAHSAPGDPRFAGAVLQKRLEEKGVRRVRRVAYLEGTERLEDRNKPLDRLIRREVVRRLEDAIRTSLREARFSRIVVAATGGFPEVSNLVEEIVRLHAPVQAESVRLHATVEVHTYEVSDGALQNPPTADRAVPRTPVFDPIVSFQARRRVLELVQKGNLLGAWAVAEPLHEHETERAWTKVVDWLRCFASSLPMPEDCDIKILKHPRMAARSALRVELALRAQDIPRAVHGTVAFWEAALWDHLLDRFQRTGKKNEGLDILQLRPGAPIPQGPELLRNDQLDEKEKGKCPFERLPGGTYVFYEAGYRAFASKYVPKNALDQLSTATVRVKWLRNDVAHNEPTPALMARARDEMRSAGLWSDKDTFLDQQLVKDVLGELGVRNPDRLLDDLLAEVRRRIVTPSASGGGSGPDAVAGEGPR
jgi:hypothetical protein